MVTYQNMFVYKWSPLVTGVTAYISNNGNTRNCYKLVFFIGNL